MVAAIAVPADLTFCQKIHKYGRHGTMERLYTRLLEPCSLALHQLHQEHLREQQLELQLRRALPQQTQARVRATNLPDCLVEQKPALVSVSQLE